MSLLYNSLYLNICLIRIVLFLPNIQQSVNKIKDKHFQHLPILVISSACTQIWIQEIVIEIISLAFDIDIDCEIDEIIKWNNLSI